MRQVNLLGAALAATFVCFSDAIQLETADFAPSSLKGATEMLNQLQGNIRAVVDFASEAENEQEAKATMDQFIDYRKIHSLIRKTKNAANDLHNLKKKEELIFQESPLPEAGDPSQHWGEIWGEMIPTDLP